MPRSDGRLVLPQDARTLVVGPDRDVWLDGTEVGIASDDGSLPGLTLVSAGTMRAYDDDGRQRWELAGAATQTSATGAMNQSRLTGPTPHNSCRSGCAPAGMKPN